MNNPYENVNWSNVQYIASASHMHLDTEAHFQSVYDHGLRHFAIGNYGIPWNPAEVVDELPSDVIVSSNTELHGGYGSFYVGTTGTGSLFAETDPEEHHQNMGRKNYVDVLDSKLKYQGAGAFVLTHPLRANDPEPPKDPEAFLPFLLDMLDYHPLIALEVYNASTDSEYNTSRTGGWADDLWDLALATGRQCYGHFNPDHMGKREAGNRNWRGRNILLASGQDEQSCLEAYANGQFFGSLLDSDLIFTNISVNDNDRTVRVETSNADELRVITDKGTTTIEDSETTFSYSDEIYIRVEAQRFHDNPESWVEENHDMIFSQPIILQPVEIKSQIQQAKERIKRMILL